MKRITLILALLAASSLVHAQLELNINAGVNRPVMKSGLGGAYNTQLIETTASPSILAGINVFGSKPRAVKVGVGLSVKGNSIDHKYSLTNDVVKTPRLEIAHRSVYASIHPVVDVSVDKKRYFHFLFNPGFYFMMWGKENGYSRTYNGQLNTYDNSEHNLKRVVLGINVQVQVRYPVTDQLRATATVGYSINNTPSSYIPAESGNVSVQLGVVLTPWAKKIVEQTEKSKAKEE